jgi:hypothetical protein
MGYFVYKKNILARAEIICWYSKKLKYCSFNSETRLT